MHIIVVYSSLFKITRYCPETCTSACLNFLSHNSALQVKLSEQGIQQASENFCELSMGEREHSKNLV